MSYASQSHVEKTSGLSARAERQRTSGLSIAEVLVVIGVVGVVLAVLLPALTAGRAAALGTSCANNLRQIGSASVAYADDSHGFVPRDDTPWADDRPSWMTLVGPYFNPARRDLWDEARRDTGVAGLLVRETPLLHCPSHPLAGRIPGTYVVNAFRFETQPDWRPDGPVRLARVRRASAVVWFAEAADLFAGERGDRTPSNFVYWPEYRDAFDPEHLPVGTRERLAATRHRGLVNTLRFDTAVAAGTPPVLEEFDDGIRGPRVAGDVILTP